MRQELKDVAGGINKLLRHSVPKTLPLFIEGVPRRGEGVEIQQALKDATGVRARPPNSASG